MNSFKPRIAALIVIVPISIYAFRYSIYTIAVALGEPATIDYSFSNIVNADSLSLIHLWFLYYLMLFCLVAAFVVFFALKYSSTIVHKIRTGYNYLFQTRKIYFVGILLTFSSMVFANHTAIEPSMNFKPDLITFYSYFIFFVFGWLMYHQQQSFNVFTKYYKWYLFGGLALCLVRWSIPFMFENHNVGVVLYLKMLVYATIAWSLVYGIIGLFIQHFKHQSSRLRYLSDASYWIYLTHLPLVAFLPSVCVSWQVPIIVKYLFVVSTATFVTVATYHFFVRSTFIGQFLNGRKY